MDAPEKKAERLLSMTDGWVKQMIIDLIDDIRQRKEQYERLNRAYEVLETKLKEMGSDYPSVLSVIAWAQRIKDGKEEPQICVDCQTRNAVNDQLCDHCYSEWENEGTLE
ncbi:hypothetical protein [Paenibacillus xylaniclasticus]|uniref:hypothetical protein n=1 Tax=Paenibacillus xylaniclasticus TaxID=588083 RepID=UPI000FDCBE36|nr:MULTISPECIES: hypothetical protein [Paenibacillus]GFN32411.1 hypothetical protein PCURB6_26710 [Paenibacillus curdlanolyticus]